MFLRTLSSAEKGIVIKSICYNIFVVIPVPFKYCCGPLQAHTGMCVTITIW